MQALAYPDIINQQLSFLSPPEDIPIDKWVEKNIILPAFTCDEPGPLRLSRTPYTRGPLKAFQSIYIDWIVLVWGRQLGKSQGVLYPCLAYSVAEDPGPALFAISNERLAKYTSLNRIQPMFDECGAVRAKKTGNVDDYSTLEMRFKDMILSLIGGCSLAQLKSRPVRYLFRDELDDFEENMTDTSDPLKTVEETTTAFAKRKIVDTSTPTTLEGNIWQQFKNCQLVFEYWVPCPECGTFQLLLWPRIKFNSKEPDREKIITETYYECSKCKAQIKEIQKKEMIQADQWRARISSDAAKEIYEGIEPEIENTILLDDVLENPHIRKIGFHLPKWYGAFYFTSLGYAAKEFLDANDALKNYSDPTKMRDWSMYWAARPYTQKVESKSVKELKKNIIALEDGICPADTVALTCGIDPGQRGFWVAIFAWKKDMSAHLIHYGYIAGGWNFIDEIIHNSEFRIDGTKDQYMKIWKAGIDTGGSKYEAEDVSMTEAAYSFIRDYGRRRVIGTKGASHSNRAGRKIQQTVIDKMPSGKKIPGGLVVWLLDTSQFKDTISYRLAIEEGKPGRFTFNSEVRDDYLLHLTSEEKQMNKKGGYDWVTIRKENHLLDASVIAFALADSEMGGVKIIRPRIPATEEKTVVQRKTGWVKGWKM